MKKKYGNHCMRTIRLTPEQDKKVKQWARKQKISENQVIRNLIDNNG